MYKYLLILSFVFFSCGRTDFEKYTSSLDQIDLPYQFSSFTNFKRDNLSYNKTLFQSYKLEHSEHPLGIFYSDSSCVVIGEFVGSDGGDALRLVSFTLEGKKIDSLNPYVKTGLDIGYEGKETIIIHPNRSISVYDTVTEMSLNKDGDDVIEGTEKTSTGITQYIISNTGQFQKQPNNGM